MPLAGFLCQANPTVKVSFEDCLECARSGENPCDFTPEMLKAMVDGGNRGTEIHATSLNTCLRQTALQLRIPFWAKPSDYWLILMGRLVHKGLEHWREPNSIIERVFTRVVAGLKIVGQPDAIYPKLKLIRDWKKPKSFPRQAKLWHEQQLNIYRWLLAPEIEVDKLEVVYFGGEPRRFAVPTWPMAQTDAWIKERASVLAPALRPDNGPDHLPPAEGGITPGFCLMCPVRGACADAMKKGK